MAIKPPTLKPAHGGGDKGNIVAHLIFLVILVVIILWDTYLGVTSIGPAGLLSLVLLPLVAILGLVWRRELRIQRTKRP